MRDFEEICKLFWAFIRLKGIGKGMVSDGPSYICYHVCLGCLGLCTFVGRKKEIMKMNWPLLEL